MSGYVHPKLHCQLAVENFFVYVHAKKQLHCPCFAGHIAKIDKLLVLNILGKPGYAHPYW